MHKSSFTFTPNRRGYSGQLPGCDQANWEWQWDFWEELMKRVVLVAENLVPNE